MDKHERGIVEKLIKSLAEAMATETPTSVSPFFPEDADRWQKAIDEARAYMDSLHPATLLIVAYHGGQAGEYTDEVREHIEKCKPCQRRLKAAEKLEKLCGGIKIFHPENI